ncbi:MAG: UPF0182 family protein [Gemmatimonadota bacterium]|nr:UPF0182 family protein [Gemmatimonadota bacterium]
MAAIVGEVHYLRVSSPFERPAPARLPPLPRSIRRALLWLVGALAVTLIVVPWLASFATDWLWFKEIGFQSVFIKSLVWRIGLFVAGAAFAFAYFYGNVRIARGTGTGFPVLYVNRGDGVSVDVSRMFTRLFLPAAFVLAFLTAISFSASWMTVLKGMNGVAVGTTDPLFGRDVSFYLFRLPLISAVLGTLITFTFLSLLAAGAMYWMRNDITLPPRRASAKPRAARHVGGLLALLFVLLAVRHWIVGTSSLLYSTTGPLLGASYTDVHVALPGLNVTAVAALVAAAWVVAGIVREKLVWAGVGATVFYVVVSILARGIVPAAYQKLVVSPNELTREAPYLRNHIAATRKAWGLDSVTSRDLSGEVQLTMANIKANAATVDNVRLWERGLLQQTFSQLQEIRTYYDFVSVDDDRYTVDGRYRQVHIAARELNSESLPTRTFINERLTFTHGMGVTMAPVNQVTDEGLPVLFIKDLPPVSTVSLKLTRPQIYYGELTKEYVFVGTKQKEFDYPAGDANIYTSYTGRGGVPIGSFIRRVLYAFQLGSLKILLSDDIRGNARILYRRTVMDRATTAMPFLDFDSDPYLIVTDAGQLKWILDAYTESDAYPYSQRTGAGTNYMRNSVKVVIDAYDGTVEAFIADPNDPVVRTYAQIFDGIFKPLSAMPADLRKHVRYPAELFRIQTLLHATYHMVQPETFYHREDQWQIPGGFKQGTNENPFMRHIVMKLPGEKDPEFIFMTPFTPRGKDNLAAWMVARMDGENYGKLSVYRFPKQSLVYGPKQIANRINQDTEISRQITLWDQRGSEVIRGELLVIPIEESLIYVQPIYLRAEGGNIPELKRVVVAHENRVVMGETLEEGLNALFGSGAAAQTRTSVRDSTAALSVTEPPVIGGGLAPVPAGTPSAAVSQLLREAQAHYDRAIAAQRAGNWTEYGREIEQLGATLRSLRAGKQ